MIEKPTTTNSELWHVSEDTRIARRAALAASRAFQERLLAERNGVLFTSSAELIREARDERDEQLP